MSVPAAKLPVPELLAMKRRGDKIVMVTAYDAPGARFAEDAGIDMILVGDTAAMVVLGHSGTTPVTVDEMLFLTRTVSRNARRPIVVGDLPFGSYETSDEDAVRTAVRFVKEGGADVVKLEGAGPMVSRARAIVNAGIPVMGHVGLTPQSVPPTRSPPPAPPSTASPPITSTSSISATRRSSPPPSASAPPG